MTAAGRGGNSGGAGAAAAISFLVLAAASGALSFLSFRFEEAPSVAAGPLIPLIGLLLIAAVAYTVACMALMRLRSNPLALACVILGSLLLAAMQLPSRPVQDADYTRYLLDGGIGACGENPYLLAPKAQKRAVATLSALRRSLPGGSDNEAPCLSGAGWKRVLSRVEQPELRTAHPPLAQLWFAAVVKLAGPSLLALRISFLLCECVLLLCLAALLERAGGNSLLVAVVGWSPLLLKEAFNSAHYDLVPATLLLVSLLFLAGRRGLAAAFVLALAAAAKLFALLLLPLWLRATQPGRRLGALGLFAVALVLCWLPFAGAGGALFEGALAFAKTAGGNAPLFPHLAAPLAKFLASAGLARTVLLATLLAVVIGLGLLWPLAAAREDPGRVARAAAFILALALLAGPAAKPWYFLWLLPLIAVDPRPSWFVLLGLLPLYYGNFWLLAHGRAEQGWLLALVEFLPALVLAAFEPLYLNRSSSGGRRRSAARPSPAL